MNTESIFAEIQAEFLTEGVLTGFVRHDDVISDVMGEIAEDYFPGVRFIA